MPPTPFRFLLDQIRRRGLLPRVSPTERAALEAGTVGVDGELFSGRPDLEALAAAPWPSLTEAERGFLDGPVAELCAAVDDHEITRLREIPEAVWTILRRERFFGLTLPRAWGGHGFSSFAASTVFGTLAARSLAVSAVVLIPNSVGPGELLLEHGTEAQRRRWLGPLARGEEIPCFALTEPEAGSDAASIRSRGVVFRGDDGAPRIRLDWDKRYITLAPVATVLGLAVVLEDPKNLLGRDRDLAADGPGITVVLVPTDLPGVETGRRHDPMGVPFPNGPTRGRGVVVGLDAVVGELDGVGRGWGMLMEALSAGRAISLPAQSVGGAKGVARVAGAYAAVRRQFGLPIGRFEGVAEPLGRIAGRLWTMEAARAVTCGAVDAGERPAVVSAMVKVRQTELLRRVVTDGMDVMGGAALCLGPRNLLARGWTGAPVGITVEGANILTRSLIVFGQGLVRCHPRVHRVLEAVEADDPKALRRAVLGQVGHAVGNGLRALGRDLVGGRLTRLPAGAASAVERRGWRGLARASSRFALLVDLALVAFGGGLKSRESVSGRFADALTEMFFVFAALRRFVADGRRSEDEPFLAWAVADGLARLQEALEAVLRAVPGPLGPLARGLLAWWIRVTPLGRPPKDADTVALAEALTVPGPLRERLTEGLFLPERFQTEQVLTEGSAEVSEPVALLEAAFAAAARAEPLRARLRRARRDGVLEPASDDPDRDRAAAVEAGVLDDAEAEALRRADALRRRAIRVDEYTPEAYRSRGRPVDDPATTEDSTTANQPEPIGVAP